MFWLTPIVYEPEQALANQPAAVWVLYYCNPMAGILQGWRAVLYHGRAPDTTALAIAAAGVLVVGYVGVRAFWTHEKRFADLI
jgi:ABC-type polysaccharide/polyol phosphate export permease